ncbi:diacylglycerol acyltransferase domain-containing protein [Ditylenchus destructor]|nr:diacylglycerol acyltransferase domain-containing protein [Ditylenchus destructor]
MQLAKLLNLLDRPLQVAAVFYYVFLFLIAPIPCMVLPFYLIFFTPLWLPTILYLTWIYLDRKTPEFGGRPSASFRYHACWRYFAQYFPIKLVKTAELPPDRNYILGSHPHGIMSIANFASFCTNGTGFDSKFPGLKSSAVTLPNMFYFPFRREVVVSSGAISSHARSIEYVLTQKGKGRAVSIVLGGAEEALDSYPDNFNLNLKSRKGFVRLALKHGASLVPVYHFGETSVYRQIDNERGSRLRNFQSAFKKRLGFTPPIFMGRGLYNYSFGVLPFRTPIHTVVGAPISVKQCSDPSSEQIDAIHAQYCQALSDLFDEHKTRYGICADAKLNMN